MSGGCISAGRPGGYFHLDWDGNISPCVFAPYAVDNIYEYRRKMVAYGREVRAVLDPIWKRKVIDRE